MINKEKREKLIFDGKEIEIDGEIIKVFGWNLELVSVPLNHYSDFHYREFINKLDFLSGYIIVDLGQVDFFKNSDEVFFRRKNFIIKVDAIKLLSKPWHTASSGWRNREYNGEDE